MDWQPIETAPKDGEIFLSYWRDVPVFVSWVGDVDDEVEYKRVGPFWNRRTEKTVISRETGFRVVSWSPRLGWGVNGNCAIFTPPAWMPLPDPPSNP